MTVDAIVTHHTDGFRSGVARFNELLAQRLAVPLVSLSEAGAVTYPLLSFKVSELPPELAPALDVAIRPGRTWEVFLHEYLDSPVERRIVEGARRVHCGNHEIAEAVAGLNPRTEILWAPGLIRDDRIFGPATVSVFSFGMAHKIRADMFVRLKTLLDASGESYAVYVSAANHETTSVQDAEAVFEEMHAIFPETLYFLGNLSDVAVSNWLRETTFFAAFFSPGLRANNTSVAAAMERGAVVITNLDEHSPPELAHMDNVIDLERCNALPSDPLVLERLSARAVQTGRARGWETLVARLR